MFQGTHTALVTPFCDGQIDTTRFKALIQAQIKGGVDGIVPVGTTGESPTISPAEHIAIVRAAVEFAKGRVKVIAGTGANSTNEAIHLTQAAEAAGADASLQVAPYYNRPSQEGLFQHFRSIAKATQLPIILYSIPGRCGVSIAAETVARLKKACRNVIGIKEAGGDADRVSQLRHLLGPRFTILSGDDALTLPFMAVGAEGVISVASNLVPREMSRMVQYFREGKQPQALAIHERLYPLFKALFLETNPVPIKTAMALAGKLTLELRLPLVPMSTPNKRILIRALKTSKIKGIARRD